MSSSSNSNQRNFVIARIAMDAANRLSAIDAEMRQLQNSILQHRRALNLFLRNVRAMDPARKEARIRATRERIEGLKERQQERFYNPKARPHCVPRTQEGTPCQRKDCLKAFPVLQMVMKQLIRLKGTD